MGKAVFIILFVNICMPLACQEGRGAFFNQESPGIIPEVFADGVVSYPYMNHSTVTIGKDMDEMYWSKWYDRETRQEIVYTKRNGKIWTEPRVVSFSGVYSDDVPFLSPDGKRLYFISRRPVNGNDNPGIERIWYVNRGDDDKWSEPVVVSGIVNCENIHWQFSVAEDYTLYYNSGEGIKFSEYINGKYQMPKLARDEMNDNYLGGNPYISPRRDYIIFSSSILPGSMGKNDLYIGYRKEDGTWSAPINLGDNINGPRNELCPYISPDGRYMFFIKQDENYDIYWVSTFFLTGCQR